ncbi:DUF982 domain-containing protein (plasmid) [Sinorhizobium sp. B11]|jgi:hypothetical protein|uniref:DUF982 domain-containing protein n=1 Tax=unclassified Rhizobium TaxID=2613769 RepID=UPI000DD5151E|nr:MULTISPECIES: DUF982 domain-containing protein [unclassified Rhizobium]MBB3445703.1 hypothetical protein [Rhizobium sp. BK379]MBB3561732.1 hypothetical protein [Rhizobium sp. BK512]
MEWNTYERFPPLVLMLGGREKYRVLRTLRDAAEVLIADWPSEDGEEYVVAVKACVDAITGQIDVGELQDAIRRAAAEAGIAILTVVH